jgi:putative inorganic carbon (HCO3(-)) transporter
LLAKTKNQKPNHKIARAIAKIELWVVICSVAISFLSIRALPWAVGIAILFWPIRRFVTGHWSVRTPADWPIVLLLLLVPLNFIVSPARAESAIQLYRLLTGVALYYAIANYVYDGRGLGLLITSSIFASLGLALFAFISVEWAPNNKLPALLPGIYPHFPILVSDTVNPNVMAGSLVILLPIMAAVPLFSWGRLPNYARLLSIIAALTVVGVILLTRSRGGILALTASLLMVIGLRWRRGWRIIGLFVILAIIGISWLGINRTMNYVMYSQTLGGLEGRLRIWSQAIEFIRYSPISGNGIGSFRDLSISYAQASDSGNISHIHNLLLQVAFDMGIPGLIAWMTIWMVVCITAWQVYQQGKRTPDRWLSGVGAGSLACQIALITHGMLDAVTWGMVRPAPIPWVVWGLAVSAYWVQRSNNRIDGQTEQG